MLSQNRARVLGFSWLRRCLNQRWMVRTSQSSCLDRPSNLFSSGCWQDKTNTLRVRWLSSWHKCHERTRNIKNDKENTGATLVIAVKTFSRMALGCAFCGPLAWIFRPMAHGLAINLQLKYHDTLQDQHRQYLWGEFKSELFIFSYGDTSRPIARRHVHIHELFAGDPCICLFPILLLLYQDMF